LTLLQLLCRLYSFEMYYYKGLITLGYQPLEYVLETVVYDVMSVRKEFHRFDESNTAEYMTVDDMAELIQQFTGGAIWDEVAGVSIEVRANLLLVNCDAATHRQIRKFLLFLKTQPVYKPGQHNNLQLEDELTTRMKRIELGTIEFQAEPLTSVVNMLSELSDISFIASPNLSEKKYQVTLKLKPVTLDKLFKILLDIKHLDYRVIPNGNNSIVLLGKPSTLNSNQDLKLALFKVENVPARNIGNEENGPFSSDEFSEIIHQYTGKNKIGSSWEDEYQGVSTHTIYNYVLVRQTPKVLDEIYHLLEKINHPVEIEAE